MTQYKDAIEAAGAMQSAGGPQHQQQQQNSTAQVKGTTRAVFRKAGGEIWVDKSLAEWPENDFRIFVGNIGPDVSEQILNKAFEHYKSFQMCKVVIDKASGKPRGYGFVSFGDAKEGALAIKEMNGKYIGNRPVQIRKSSWDERKDNDRGKKNKKNKLGARDLTISNMSKKKRKYHIGAMVEAARGLE